MDTATKRGTDAEEIASKRVVRKRTEATRDLIGNKITNKTTSASKTKSKEKEDETNKRQEIYTPSEKIIDDLSFF